MLPTRCISTRYEAETDTFVIRTELGVSCRAPARIVLEPNWVGERELFRLLADRHHTFPEPYRTEVETFLALEVLAR